MFLSGIGTAAPSARWTQPQCWDALVASGYLPTLNQRSQAILRKVLRGNNGICTRHLAFDNLSEAFEFDPDVLDARFATHAPAVASQAARVALDEAGLDPDAIDAVMPLLQDPRTGVPEAIVRAFGAIATEHAVDVLINAPSASSGSPNVARIDGQATPVKPSGRPKLMNAA